MNNIKKLRKAQNMSVTELATRLNMSQSNLTKIENGQVELKQPLAEKIAEALNVALPAVSEELGAAAVAGSLSLPLLNPADAGLPEQMFLPLPTVLLPPLPPHSAVFYVNDDAMGKHFPKSSLVIAKEENLSKEDGVFIIREGERLLLRRLQFGNNNVVTILSDNHCYPSRQCAENELKIVARALVSIKIKSL